MEVAELVELEQDPVPVVAGDRPILDDRRHRRHFDDVAESEVDAQIGIEVAGKFLQIVVYMLRPLGSRLTGTAPALGAKGTFNLL